MITKHLPTILAIAIATSAAVAHADIISVNGVTYTTEFNTGSGPDNALLVLEYGSGATYLFGYSWDPSQFSPTGETMLTDVAAASTATSKPLTYTLESFSFGNSFDSIRYDGHNVTTNIFDPSSPYFDYETSDNGAPLASSDVGAGDRDLFNNSIDDWVYQPTSDWPPTVPPSFVVATATTPEPASLSLLALSGVLLLKRRHA